MSELRYPNESQQYRDARDALLNEERELVDKVKSVAAKRRDLPLGGQLKEDYVFHWANDGKVGKSVKFSELFEDKNTERRDSERHDCTSFFAQSYCFIRSCSARTGTIRALPARRWSMDLIGPRIRSLKTPRLSPLPKLRPSGLMRGPKNEAGRRLRWFPDRPLPIRPITNVRETLMICNCQLCMFLRSGMERCSISGELN
jgi:hypothetical protein